MHASPEQLIALRDNEIVDAVAQAHVRGCAHCAAELNTLVDLRTRLGQLPQFAVPEAAWQAISARLVHGDASHGLRRNGWRAVAMALVASVVVAVVWAMFPSTVIRPAGSSVAVGTPPASLPQLMVQSSYLEHAVMSLNADADHMAISAGTAATVAALEDRIALLDYQINHAALDARGRDRLPQLWQQRVNLLQSLAAVRYAQVASNDI